MKAVPIRRVSVRWPGSWLVVLTAVLGTSCLHAASAVGSGCGSIAVQEPSPPDPSPEDPSPADRPGSESTGGTDREAVDLATNRPAAGQADFSRAARYSEEHSGRALLILRDGQTVLEQYAGGWEAERPHPLASGTKSFTGIMAMMAVQEGLFSLDDRVSEVVTEWQADPRKATVTVRQLLTLCSGLPAGDRELSGGSGGSRILGEGAARRAERLGLNGNTERPENLNLAAIGLELVDEPGARFRYGPSHFLVFSEFLQRKLQARGTAPSSTLDYLQERVLEPIGIEAARIGRDRAGNPNLPGGMMLTARNWSRLGQFVLDGGSVRQSDGTMRNLLKPELLQECFVPCPKNRRYGLTWWLRSVDSRADSGGGEEDGGSSTTGAERDEPGTTEESSSPEAGERLAVYMAAGLGKQRLYVIPHYRMVMVRFAEATREGERYQDQRFLELVLEAVGRKE